MPEGDTVHKIAAFLAPRLVGETLTEATLADPAAARRCAGRRVRAVVARGKHLFIELDDGLAIRSHLGMHGAWHRYPHGAARPPTRKRLSLLLATRDWDYICYNAKDIELLRAASVRERIVRGRLGPDLVADAVDPAALARRARDFVDGDALLADALLDQRIASGIGNVYKSEVLFIEGLAPDTRLADVDDAAIARCYATAADLLRRNLGGGRRVTRFVADGAGRAWVYGRGGQPCLRCATPIESHRLGRHRRATYWCPACQRARPAGVP